MRKLCLLILGLLCFNLIKAQDVKDDGKTEVIYCSEFKITKPLRDLVSENSNLTNKDIKEKKEMLDKEFRRPYMAKTNPDALPKGEDPACQKVMGSKELKAPINSWAGLAGDGYPPDPTGAAGPNHYLQAVNLSYKIYTKTGGAVTNGGPFNLGDLLFNVNQGDPIVMYDKFADRWFVSQFGTTSSKKIYIAISQTNDPTGSYYTYQFTANSFPDYLKFSIWTDGYYMTHNSTSQRVYVFERSVMLTGGSGARMISKTYSPPNDGGFFCPLAGFADGQLPPAGTPCPLFSYEDDGWGTGHVDRINIYEMAVTWGTTPASTITLKAQLPTLAFDASYDSYWDDIAQPGTSGKLDGIGGVFTFRAQYRVWTGYNSVVLCCGVLVNSTSGQRSIRWYELRQNSSTGAWSIYQQSTYTPDSYNRWCGSIAMDDNGSIGMAYAVSGSSTVYPSIRYTGRTAADALNTMTYSEQIAKAGSSSQTATNRFGDYSHTSMDPVDGTLFWHTGEYIASGGNPATWIFSFKIPVTVSVEDFSSEAAFTAYQSNGKLNIKVNNLPYDDEFIVDIFDITGKKISGKIVNPLSGTIETSFQTSGMAAGTYLIRVGKNNTSFQLVKKVVIN